VKREQRPEVLINPADGRALGLADGDIVRIGNVRGQTRMHARLFEGVSRGVLVSEGVWPPSAFLDGWGVNVLVGDDSVAPHGGVAFHDVRVWARRA
jgi:anaerobic selenocysteine-containing dehydrogenase